MPWRAIVTWLQRVAGRQYRRARRSGWAIPIPALPALPSAWQSRVQVGRTYRKSPVFRDALKYLVFNPTWTVPYSIATRDLLPQIKEDRGFFASRGFDLRDRQGQLIDPGPSNTLSICMTRRASTCSIGRIALSVPVASVSRIHSSWPKSC